MIFCYTHFSSLTGGSNWPLRCLDLKCDFEAHFLYQLFAQFHFRRYTLVLEGGTRGFQGKYSINLEKAHNHSVRKTSILRHAYNCFYMARVRSPYLRNEKFWEPIVAFQALIWENSECLEQHLLGMVMFRRNLCCQWQINFIYAQWMNQLWNIVSKLLWAVDRQCQTTTLTIWCLIPAIEQVERW